MPAPTTLVAIAQPQTTIAGATILPVTFQFQYAAGTGSNGNSLLCGSANRRKYHDESTNVSIVSVSRRAGPPHLGHLTLTNSGTCASGESPRPVNVVTFGSSTGRSLSGTATTPSLSQ